MNPPSAHRLLFFHVILITLVLCSCTSDLAGNLELLGEDTLLNGDVLEPSEPPVEPDSDDDDSNGDDDDAAGDDDDTNYDFSEVTGVIHLLATAHQPQGRSSFSYGYFAQDLDASNLNDQGSRLPFDPARGKDFGCEVQQPDERGEETDHRTFDAGKELHLYPTEDTSPFSIDLQRIVDANTHYQSEAISGLPPLGAYLDLRTDGGSELAPLEVSEAIWMPNAITVSEPSLSSGQAQLEIIANRGMAFEWSPTGFDGMHIGMEFYDTNSGEYWSLDCWVEDSGSFVVGAEHLQYLPTYLDGTVWLRQYKTKYLPAGVGHPDIYGVGMYQKRWFLLLLEEDDKPIDG